MVELIVSKNIVLLTKSQNDYQDFVSTFLVKYEDVTKIDIFNNKKGKKAFRSVKERRNLYSETDQFIIFSRGILEFIPKEVYSAKYVKEDTNIVTPDLSDDQIKITLDSFDLREDQILAVKKSLFAKRGVIQLPTGTGKSAIIVSIIKRLLEFNPDMKFLVIAPTLSTVKNIHDSLKNNGVSSEIFGHPHKNIISSVTVSLVNSLIKSKDLKLLYEINAVVYDECLPSNSLISMPDGSYKSISDIFLDDKVNEVLSYNLETSQYEVKRILKKYKTPYNSRFCKVYYRDINDGDLKGITCTPNHKIYTRDRGYVQAQDLTNEDFIKIDYPFARNVSILSNMTFRRVERVSHNIGKVALYKYNIEVEDNHNYFANNVLVSNCHHLKCETWNQLNSMIPNVEYSLGFSALSIDKSKIYEKDIRNLSYEDSLIVGSSGPVVMHMDPSYYINKGIIALPIVFRVVNKELLPSYVDPSNWHELVKNGLMSTSRTCKVATIAKIFSDYNRRVLVLVSEKDYAFTVCEYLSKIGCNSFGVSFGAGKGYLYKSSYYDENNKYCVEYNDYDSLSVLDKLNEGEISVLVATNHLDEGVDVKGLDACILSNGGKKDRRIIQRVGRVLRKSKNGKYAYIVDFTDESYPVLSRQSKLRLDMYRNDVGVPESNIYDHINVEDIESKLKELEEIN